LKELIIKYRIKIVNIYEMLEKEDGMIYSNKDFYEEDILPEDYEGIDINIE